MFQKLAFGKTLIKTIGAALLAANTIGAEPAQADAEDVIKGIGIGILLNELARGDRGNSSHAHDYGRGCYVSEFKRSSDVVVCNGRTRTVQVPGRTLAGYRLLKGRPNPCRKLHPCVIRTY